MLLSQERACLVCTKFCVQSPASPITCPDGPALRRGMQENQNSSHPPLQRNLAKTGLHETLSQNTNYFFNAITAVMDRD